MAIYPDLSTVNATKGPQELLVYANGVTSGLFIGMALAALFFIILIATYTSQKNKTGYGDFFASFAVAGFLTFILSLLLSLVQGLVGGITLIITSAIAVLGIIFLMFAKREQ